MKILFVLLFSFSYCAHGQIGINTTTPDASSVLDITSTSKGLLPPRLTNAQRDAITGKVQGLVIYNTQLNGIEYYNGSEWIQVYDKHPSSGGSAIISSYENLPGSSVGPPLRRYVQPGVTGGLSLYYIKATVTQSGTYSIYANSGTGFYFYSDGFFAAPGTYTLTIVGAGASYFTSVSESDYFWLNTTPGLAFVVPILN